MREIFVITINLSPFHNRPIKLEPLSAGFLSAPSFSSHPQLVREFPKTPVGFALSRLWNSVSLNKKNPSERDAFRIIGDGEIGDKARQLILKHTAIRRIGFHCPARVVLAEGALDDFFRFNGFSDSLKGFASGGYDISLSQRIREGKLSPNLRSVMRALFFHFHPSNRPVIFRSSACGDGRGTGIYKSLCSVSSINPMFDAFKKVLASYFSENAFSFRKNTNTEGFGIIVEPLVGQQIADVYAPVISGYGFTASMHREGFVCIVPGLGGGVDSGNGEVIQLSELKKSKGHLEELVLKKQEAINFHNSTPRRSSLLLRIDPSIGMIGYRGRAFCYSPYVKPIINEVCLEPYSQHGQDMTYQRLFKKINLNPLVEMMEELTDACGASQYIEWAITWTGGQQRLWMIQIADAKESPDILFHENPEKRLFSAHSVVGSGERPCSALVVCYNPLQLERLKKFNQHHRDYILVYSSNLTTSSQVRIRLDYASCSNAAALIEITEGDHCRTPRDHWRGALDESNIFFGVMDYDSVGDQFDLLRDRSFRVISGPFIVKASEAKNYLLVEK